MCLHSLSLWSVLYVSSMMHFLMRSGSVYTGVEFSKRLCGISVIRRYRLFRKYFPSILSEALIELTFGTHTTQKLLGFFIPWHDSIPVISLYTSTSQILLVVLNIVFSLIYAYCMVFFLQMQYSCIIYKNA